MRHREGCSSQGQSRERGGDRGSPAPPPRTVPGRVRAGPRCGERPRAPRRGGQHGGGTTAAAAADGRSRCADRAATSPPPAAPRTRRALARRCPGHVGPRRARGIRGASGLRARTRGSRAGPRPDPARSAGGYPPDTPLKRSETGSAQTPPPRGEQSPGAPSRLPSRSPSLRSDVRGPRSDHIIYWMGCPFRRAGSVGVFGGALGAVLAEPFGDHGEALDPVERVRVLRKTHSHGRDGKVHKASTAAAKEVVVGLRIGVEAPLSPRDKNLLEYSQVSEQGEGRVDGRSARHREAAGDGSAELRGGPVAALCSQVPDDGTPLGGQGKAARAQSPLDHLRSLFSHSWVSLAIIRAPSRACGEISPALPWFTASGGPSGSTPELPTSIG